MRLILKIYTITLLFFLIACEPAPQVMKLDIKNADLKLTDGIMLYKGKPYTGNTFFKNDTIVINTASYVNGKKHGEEKRFFYNGNVAVSRSYTNGEPTGTHKTWWENKQLKSVYDFDEAGNKIGIHREWYRDGRLAKEFHYTNGKEDGTQKIWNLDGEIEANYIVINGERFGLIGSVNCKPDNYVD